MSRSGYVHLDVEQILQETEAAFKVLLPDGEELWLPKSQIADQDEYKMGDLNLTLSITEWIARQKGLEVDS